MAVSPKHSRSAKVSCWQRSRVEIQERMKLLLETDRKLEVCSSLESIFHRRSRGALFVKEVRPVTPAEMV